MKKRYFAILILSVFLSSCNDDALFEKEMYKNLVALISSEYYNTFQETIPLTGEEVEGHIAASAGGTHASEKDLIITLSEDQSALDKYNWSLFDADENLYAKLLPRNKYVIEDYQIKIKAGERTGRTMVKINPAGLSPDSTYFISLKAENVDNVEINEKKNTILYQVLIKNNYASQANDDYYAMSGLVDGMVTAGNKKLFPLTKTDVRLIVGTESFENNLTNIENKSMVLQVNPDSSVTIKPYKGLSITQINGNERYPNKFMVEDIYGRKFNVFAISYQYKIGNITKVMQEELRLEIKPE